MAFDESAHDMPNIFQELSRYSFTTQSNANVDGRTSNLRTPAPLSSPVAKQLTLDAPFQFSQPRSTMGMLDSQMNHKLPPPHLLLDQLRPSFDVAPHHTWTRFRDRGNPSSSPGTPIDHSPSTSYLATPPLTEGASSLDTDSSRRTSCALDFESSRLTSYASENASFLHRSPSWAPIYYESGKGLDSNSSRRSYELDRSKVVPGLGLQMSKMDSHKALAALSRDEGTGIRKRQLSFDERHERSAFPSQEYRPIPSYSYMTPSDQGVDYFTGPHYAEVQHSPAHMYPRQMSLDHGDYFEHSTATFTRERRYSPLPMRAQADQHIVSADHSASSMSPLPVHGLSLESPLSVAHPLPSMYDTAIASTRSSAPSLPVLQHRHSFACGSYPDNKRPRRDQNLRARTPDPSYILEREPIDYFPAEILPAKRQASLNRIVIDPPTSDSVSGTKSDLDGSDDNYQPASDDNDHSGDYMLEAEPTRKTRVTRVQTLKGRVANSTVTMPLTSSISGIVDTGIQDQSNPAWLARRPPADDFDRAVDVNMAPRSQRPRFNEDMYTPRWIRGSGNQKEGWCALCDEGKWLQLKNSAFWYHKQYTHGISSTSGYNFLPPLETRNNNDGSVDGLCHGCQKWQKYKPKKSSAGKGPAVWWRHCHKCHLYYTPKGREEDEEEDDEDEAMRIATAPAVPVADPLTLTYDLSLPAHVDL